MNKTKLAALGMLTSLICILSVGTHEIWGTDPPEEDDCPHSVYGKIECPLNAIPICQGAPEIPCPKLIGAILEKDQFKNPDPKSQWYDYSIGMQPETAQPIQKMCYRIYQCKAVYDDITEEYLRCEPDTNKLKGQFLAPTFPGTPCPKQ
ncbi:MAG: hypothetical protein N2112_08620 [Gemmataceae bacterium]|jgi:hypothetical protein|nr:hypothetical protein [Gemmataceae bacterium]